MNDVATAEASDEFDSEIEWEEADEELACGIEDVEICEVCQ